MKRRRKIAFLCVANSARSQMAEGWARHLYSDSYEAVSAGSAPGQLHPMAVRAMAEVGVDLRSQFAKGLDALDFSTVDMAVTLCAAEACPVLPDGVAVRHEPFEDPAAAAGGDAETLAAFREVRDAIRRSLHGGLSEAGWFSANLDSGRAGQKMATRLIHAGETHELGSVATPLFPSSNYIDGDGLPYHEIRYARLGTVPNQMSLAAKLADVCGGESAVVLASGMAALSTALLSHLSAGDHVLVQAVLYGGTMALAREDLPRWGITVDALDGNPEKWPSQFQDNTRVVLTEALTNPTLRSLDHRRLLEVSRAFGVTTMIDSTVPSPVNFRPLEFGYDVEIQSATKYIGGHSDVVAGAVISDADTVLRVRKMMGHLGGSLDPRACWLLQRGMKTMHLRVARQNASATAIARFLDAHPKVDRVNYPALTTHPDHSLAEGLFDGYGGLLSLQLDRDVAATTRFVNGLKLFAKAASFGGVESLVTRPATSSHASVPAAERARLGISDGLVRLAVGVEDCGDLIADLHDALALV